MEKIKPACNKKEAAEIKKISDFETENKFNWRKHKTHSDNNRNCTFKFELVFFHFKNNPPNTVVFKITKVTIYLYHLKTEKATYFGKIN